MRISSDLELNGFGCRKEGRFAFICFARPAEPAFGQQLALDDSRRPRAFSFALPMIPPIARLLLRPCAEPVAAPSPSRN
jgi:hypothetical protein